MYETFDHTADLGLRIKADDLPSLFADAAHALFDVIVDDLSLVQPQQVVDVNLQSDELVYLLFDWLNHLLFLFDAKGWLFSRFDVQVNESACRLQGKAWGERLDPSRHVLAHEVKAITYHGLRIEQKEGGWLAEVIVDI